MLQEFSSTWNNHSVRTERHRTPLQIWPESFYRLAPTDMNGLLDLTDSSFYGIDDDGPTPELQTANDVQVPEIDTQLSVDQENYLASTFSPCADGIIRRVILLLILINNILVIFLFILYFNG